MVNLVADQLNSALDSKLVQRLQLSVSDGRARGIVRAVDQDKLDLRVRESHDLLRIDAEAVLAAHAIEASFEAKRLRKRGERSESRQRDDDVRAGLRSQPHQRHQ